MSTKSMTTRVQGGKIYHVYNRANNHGRLFHLEADYMLFLDCFKRFVYPRIDLFAYCLISNHYHFLFRVHDDVSEKEFAYSFASMLKCYTTRINMKYGRRGGLYQGRYRRREVRSERYFRKLILYIHLNPLKHGVTSHPIHYKYSSYGTYFRHDETMIAPAYVLRTFDSMENFRQLHEVGVKQLHEGSDPLGDQIPPRA